MKTKGGDYTYRKCISKLGREIFLERERDFRIEERDVCENLEVRKKGGKEMRHVAIENSKFS